MKSRLIINLAIILTLSLVMFGCTTGESPEDVEEVDDVEVSSDVSEELLEEVRAEEGTLYIYDWAEWWPDEVFEGFSNEYDIEVVRDHFADLDEMLTRFTLNPNLEYDLTFPDNRVFMEMKERDLLQPIKIKWLPNVEEYMLQEFKDVWFNPDSSYGVINNLSFTGYVYNSNYVDESDSRVGSWELLLEGEEFAGNITMINSMYEVVGAALKYLGYSWNSNDEHELMEAKELLIQQKELVMAYDSWPSTLVIQEQALLSNCWIGEGWFYSQELESIKAVLPEEGTEMLTDMWVIPAGSKNPATAHLFLNYLFRPEVYALMIETIGYSPVHSGAFDLLPQEMLDWPGVMPTEEELEKCEFINKNSFTGEGLKLRQQIWEELKR